MASAPSGFLWDDARNHGKSARIFGEFGKGIRTPRQLEGRSTPLSSETLEPTRSGPSRFASGVVLVAERAERHQEFTLGSQPIVDVTSVLAPASDE